MMRSGICFFKDWWKREDGLAAVESAFVFPILLTLILGVFDMGYGILAAQKTIRASQVTADLIARHRSVSFGEIDEAIDGGELSLVPYPMTSYGVDIVSIEFDDEGDPFELWRVTRNMSPNDTVMDSLEGLGGPGEGLVAVTVKYDYQPSFSGFVVREIPMQEVSYVRGRLTATVPLEGS